MRYKHLYTNMWIISVDNVYNYEYISWISTKEKWYDNREKDSKGKIFK